MIHKTLLSTAVCAAILFGGLAAADAKRPLGHDDFDAWESAKIEAMSRNGGWSAYSKNPQEGDGTLTLRDNRKGRKIEIPRGYSPAFTADGKWAVALIKPFFANTRQAKIDKKKDFDLPQDSLVIVDLTTAHIEKIPHVIGYKLPERDGTFVAYQSCDTLHIKPADLKDKEVGRPLMIRSLTSPVMKMVKWVKDYGFSKDGSRLALNLKKAPKDSLTTDGVAMVNLPDTSLLLLDRDKKFYTLPVFNEQGTALAYTASTDSIDSGTRHAMLYYADLTALQKGEAPVVEEYDYSYFTRTPQNLSLPHAEDPELQGRLEKERADYLSDARGTELRLNQYSRPRFSRNGRFLIAGVAPVIAPDDTTLVDFEKADIDIWRWDAPYTIPQEKGNLDALRKKGMPVVMDLKNGRDYRLLTKNELVTVEPAFEWDSEWVLLHDPSERMVEQQWNYLAPETLILLNVVTGETKPVGTFTKENSALSPDGRFVVIYDDRNFYAYDRVSGETVNISEKIPYPVWEEDDDHPMERQAYGIGGWGDGDNRVLIYDRHDIWSVDMTGKSEPVNFTAGDGRKRGVRYRYRRLDPEEKTLKPGENMVLGVFDYGDKRYGLATTSYGKPMAPVMRMLDKHYISQLQKAKEADVYMWQQGNFEVMPDLYVSLSPDFAKGVKLTAINPQLKDISWGTARLVEWYAYDGKKTQGVLYLPEGFDPSATDTYPMLSVFYETGSESLYFPYRMEPSWSWVNYPFYVSRGYVVFVPDIHYTSGVPGECAYNYVCSGVEEMCRRYPAIDRKRLGIDGQSWGGYQTAYLVTRTNMFACAGSGAPVANMTSAFGGIRWGTGDSRQAQYEMGQSRIGRNLWDATEYYIANSPVFHANRVETPLLIMHNDADEAVPWYQGIEMFMALRRLEKPVWLLQYNGESHNIKERRNRKDITKRLQQFFDHYLKGEPMPRWMREGISPLRKGQDYGF
ncbi:MAG: prolyl oligopeptidase family serine peptidase [Muribaculaceae bacterium]|nr:prolyl oligopeptidase family serine peptidase [Muribaculaceae bacterium]